MPQGKIAVSNAFMPVADNLNLKFENYSDLSFYENFNSYIPILLKKSLLYDLWEGFSNAWQAFLQN